MIVVLEGELDLAGTDELEGRFVGAGSCPDLRIDLGDVEFLDCAALAVIIDASLRCREAGGRVTLHRPRPLVRHMLEVSRLADAVALADEPALSALA